MKFVTLTHFPLMLMLTRLESLSVIFGESNALREAMKAYKI